MTSGYSKCSVWTWNYFLSSCCIFYSWKNSSQFTVSWERELVCLLCLSVRIRILPAPAFCRSLSVSSYLTSNQKQWRFSFWQFGGIFRDCILSYFIKSKKKISSYLNFHQFFSLPEIFNGLERLHRPLWERKLWKGVPSVPKHFFIPCLCRGRGL